MNPLSTYFEQVPDPRGHSNAQIHLLLDILTIALWAMLAGAETFADKKRFGREKQAWLKERLGLKLRGGIPSHDIRPTGTRGDSLRVWIRTPLARRSRLGRRPCSGRQKRAPLA